MNKAEMKEAILDAKFSKGLTWVQIAKTAAAMGVSRNAVDLLIVRSSSSVVMAPGPYRAFWIL